MSPPDAATLDAATPAAPRPAEAGETAACRNCGAARVGPYCHRCGQAAARRSLRALAGTFVREVVDADGRLPRSVRLLLGKPGLLTALYVRGRRARFTSPLRLYLLASLLFFGAFQLTHATRHTYAHAQAGMEPGSRVEALAEVPEAPPEGASWSERTRWRLRRGAARQIREPLAFTSRFAGALSTALLLALPLLSLALKLLVRRRPLYDHVVFALHFGAVFLLAFLAFMMLGVALKAALLTRPGLAARLPNVSPPLYGLLGLTLIGYLFGALRRAYRLASGAAAWRTAGLAVVALAIYAGSSFAAALATLYRMGGTG